VAVAVVLALGLAGCAGASTGDPAPFGASATGDPAATGDPPAGVAQALINALPGHWSADKAEYGQTQTIDLANGSAKIDAPGAYRLTGRLADGQVTVAVKKKGLVQLVLDGADITSQTSAAINVEAADEVVIILADGSSNAVTDAAVYAEPDGEPDAAIFSKVDLSIAGGGALEVAGRAGDAIASKDGLVIAGGQLTVTAADDAVKGRDYLRLAGGQVTIEAGGDALKATNADDAGAGYVLLEGGAVTAKAAADCVDAATDALVTAGSAVLTCGDDAIHGEARLVVDGGAIDVRQSVEGLEAPVLVLAGGEIRIVASDDGLNAAASSEDSEDSEDSDGADAGGGGRGFAPGRGAMGVQEGVSLSITGGEIWIEAGSDGIDANGPGVIAGGLVTVYAQANGMNGPFDIAEGGPTITGGTVVAYGTGAGRGAILSPDQSSTQTWVAASWAEAASGLVEVTDQTGAVIVSLETDQSVSAVVISAPGLLAGDVYTLALGGLAVQTTAGEATSGFGGGPGGDGGGPGQRGGGRGRR
jgi:hypothetical protein